LRVLLVEDDLVLFKAMERLLIDNGCVVDHAPTLAFAEDAILDYEYDIILLDRGLPDGEGLTLIDYCQRNDRENRIVVLTAQDQLEEKIEGLDLGAYDYIVKPFEPEELLARIRAAIRHKKGHQVEPILAGNVSYNPETRDLLIEGKAFVVPRREMVLLEAFVKRFRRIVTREFLQNIMYGYDDELQSNSVESHVSRLRKNLRKANSGLKISSIRGVGYVLQEET